MTTFYFPWVILFKEIKKNTYAALTGIIHFPLGVHLIWGSPGKFQWMSWKQLHNYFHATKNAFSPMFPSLLKLGYLL